jgi:hypothetical protein
MLELDKRPCKIGTSINTRRELHGEDPVPAMDIPLANILLTKAELNELLDDRHAWDMLYLDHKGKPAEPMFGKVFKPFALLAKYSGDVAIYVGLKPEMIELADVKLTKLKLEPQTGGLTALSLTVQATPDMHAAARLFEHLDCPVDVLIEFADPDEDSDEEQPELNLDAADSAAPAKAKRKPRRDTSSEMLN